MNRMKLLAAAFSVAAMLILSPLCHAQANIPPAFNAAGSSAAFNAMAIAAGGTVSAGGACGGTFLGGGNWTKKSTATGVDNRSSSISAITANIWIVWNNVPEPNRTVCAYLQTDSIVGQRLYFAVPRGSVSLPSSAIGESGDNLVPLFPTDTALPSNIYNDINNQPFNCSPSDIRPEDAEFGTTRALAALTTNRSGLGYGPGPIGATILSPFSSNSTQVVAFNLSGTDPITSMHIPAYTTTNVGGQVMLVLANTTIPGGGHFSDPTFTNVDRFVLAGYWDSTFTRTRDMAPQSGLSSFPAHVLIREPLSGTMNTMEFSLTRDIEINSSQEHNVNPSVDNPLNQTYATGGTRQRVVGNSEMLTEIGAIGDSLGYAFFSFGNAAKVLTTAKYLTVDGVDPINESYTNGALPTCTAPCPGAVTFPHVLDGSYPVWNILRITTATPVPAFISNLVAAAQSDWINNVPDLVPISQMQVFRSHYTQSGVMPHNGHLGRGAESGGDVGGAVYTVQADLDNITDTGRELTNKKQ